MLLLPPDEERVELVFELPVFVLPIEVELELEFEVELLELPIPELLFMLEPPPLCCEPYPPPLLVFEVVEL